MYPQDALLIEHRSSSYDFQGPTILGHVEKLMEVQWMKNAMHDVAKSAVGEKTSVPMRPNAEEELGNPHDGEDVFKDVEGQHLLASCLPYLRG